jgi:hypothetical protein
MLTSNLGFEQWPAALGTPSLLTPALDRLLDAGHVITFPPDAPSYRAQRTAPPGPLPPSRHKRARRAPSRAPTRRSAGSP